MVRFFLNNQLFNNPRDWAGFSTEFKRDFGKRIISVQYTDQVTFAYDAHDYIKSIQEADGYCAAIDLRVEEQCGSGPWMVTARGKVIMADCEWNETKCTVRCSVADNGIGARVENNKKVPVSPLAELSKNNVAIDPVVPLALTVFASADGSTITGARRAFDWFKSLQHAIAYITDGAVDITSEWYAALDDGKQYAIAVGSELRTSGQTVPRISWTFDDLFNEISKKHNLWLFASEDEFGNPYLTLEPESYFLGDNVAGTIVNIEDLTRRLDLERLYATVDVGSSDAIYDLVSDYPLPFVVLLGFTKESFHFKGVCNTSASLDLVNKWVIDTNVIYQIVEEGNEDYDENIIVIQYYGTTSQATRGNYLFLGAAPYLYNEQLLSINVLPRFPLPSSVGANFASGSDDSFRATYTSVVPGLAWLAPPILAPVRYHLRGDNDYDLPNFDTNNAWGNGTTPGNPVSVANSRYTTTSQGLYVFSIGIHWAITLTYPAANFLGNYSQYSGAFIRVYADIYNSLNVLTQTIEIGDTNTRWLQGQYFDTFQFPISLQGGNYVEFWIMNQEGLSAYNFDLGAPIGPTPASASPFYYGRSVFGLKLGSYVETTAVVRGGVSVVTEPSRTLTFTLERSVTISEWLNMIRNPWDGVIIDGQRFVHPLKMKRKVTGDTTFELIRQP